MDLITTGVSASERLRKQNLVEAARNLITEKMQLGGPSMRIAQVIFGPVFLFLIRIAVCWYTYFCV